MPFPAISLPAALAIGLSIGAIGIAAQGKSLRRRAARRTVAGPDGPGDQPPGSVPTPGVRADASAPAVAPARPAANGRHGVAPRAPAAPRKRATALRTAAHADPPDITRKRQVAFDKGLEAIVTFVDGPVRRAGASACADALVLAVPKAERGRQVSAFLRAAGAKEAPARLQEMAEDAGVEIAMAIKALNAEIKPAGG
jgi:hypothetical protein